MPDRRRHKIFLAAAPALSIAVAKIVIDRVVENSKRWNQWIYGVAVPVSALAWFYHLMTFSRNFSITELHWGRPAYS